jgi:hypothetical protein
MIEDEVRTDGGDWGPKEPPDLLGRYANYFTIGHNAFEFVLDFGQFFPESTIPQLHTRIITSPAYAVALLTTLRESVARYEETFQPLTGA